MPARIDPQPGWKIVADGEEEGDASKKYRKTMPSKTFIASPQRVSRDTMTVTMITSRARTTSVEMANGGGSIGQR
ncbi:unnamed protein product, partial [Discosporangium mesarthrocarpum]